MKNKNAVCERIVLFAGALIYALLYAMCSQVDERGYTIAGEGIRRFAIVFPVALTVLYLLFRYVLRRTEMVCSSEQMKPLRFFGTWALIFACYIPVFLFVYPGTFLYDTRSQVMQFVPGQYSEFHPLLHTVFLGFCMSLYDFLQSYEKCAAVYSLIQMLLVSACFAAACSSIMRSISKKAANIATAFFALHPLNVLFASNCTKDVLFSAFLTLFFSLCLEEIRLQRLSCRRRILQIVSGVLACLLRNNMIYAMVVWTVILVSRRKAFIKTALYTAVTILISYVAANGMAFALHADEGRIVEMLSVPVQQIVRVRVLTPEKLTREEKDQMDIVFRADLQAPEKTYEEYEPTISDPMKGRMNDEYLKQNFWTLGKMWLDVGMRCPRIYMDAFLNLALGSLYPYREYHVVRNYVEFEGDELMSFYGLPSFTLPGRFASVRKWIKTEICETGANHIPIVKYLFNTGLYYWVLLLFMLYEAYCGNWNRVTILLLPALLWGTYLLGPVMQGRYLYPFVCMLPLFVLRPKQETADTSGIKGGYTDDV